MIAGALFGWLVLAVVLTVVLCRVFRGVKRADRRRLEGWRRHALEMERAAERESEAAADALMERLARHIAEARRS